jgi:thiamine biosynthesis lipoprotein
MGTLVTIEVVGHARDPQQIIDRDAGVARAFEWFRHVEACCSRFEAESEVMKLTTQIGVAVHVSDMLFEAVQFALAVAEETGGAFDPTVGHAMATRGFNRSYRTGRAIRTDPEPGEAVSYRHVQLDLDHRTIMLLRPLILDLGAVAKGLAIDMAARELRPFEDFAIDAGGDLYFGGHNREGLSWSVGIRHPRPTSDDDQLIDALQVCDAAVCTSGDYERTIAGEDSGHHILDPGTGLSANAVASVTVVAPTAMAADALATAAFVLGPTDGIPFLERQGVDGLIVTATMERFATRGMGSVVTGG